MADPKIVIVLDPQLIGQMIINLLSNAIYYTDEGKTITILAERKGRKEGGY